MYHRKTSDRLNKPTARHSWVWHKRKHLGVDSVIRRPQLSWHEAQCIQSCLLSHWYIEHMSLMILFVVWSIIQHRQFRFPENNEEERQKAQKKTLKFPPKSRRGWALNQTKRSGSWKFGGISGRKEWSKALLKRLREESQERIPFTLIPSGFKWKGGDSVWVFCETRANVRSA